MNCIRVNTNPLLIFPFSRADSVYSIELVISNTAPNNPEPTDTIIGTVETYPYLENKSNVVFANIQTIIKKAIPGIPYEANG